MLRWRFGTVIALRRLKKSSTMQACDNGTSPTIESAPSTNADDKDVQPPHYIPLNPKKHTHLKHKTMQTAEVFNNEGNSSGVGPRLHEYQKMRALVRSIPTAAERIHFVNPYEREWTRREIRFHRPWLHKLLSTRKAWAVRSIPVYFDSINFYQYITKMKLIEGLDSWYIVNMPTPPSNFMDRFHETMRFHLNETNVSDESERTTRILRSLLDLLVECLVESREYPDLANMRISYAPRCESFWIRSGFESLYDDTNFRHKIRGDHRARFGELAFVLRDKFAAHIRRHDYLKPLVSITDPIANSALFDETVNIIDDIIFLPSIYGLHPDLDPLWQCPGFEPDCGEPNKFGFIAFKECSQLSELCKYWKLRGEDETIVRGECFRASAVASLFSWLNAQAHSIGHTQYNDIEQPLVSQLVLSDGKQYFFAVAQLNTLQINVELEGLSNQRINLCYVEGPVDLYDRYDTITEKFWHRDNDGKEVEGVNPHVLTRIMQMLVKDSMIRPVTNHDEYTAFSKYSSTTFEDIP